MKWLRDLAIFFFFLIEDGFFQKIYEIWCDEPYFLSQEVLGSRNFPIFYQNSKYAKYPLSVFDKPILLSLNTWIIKRTKFYSVEWFWACFVNSSKTFEVFLKKLFSSGMLQTFVQTGNFWNLRSRCSFRV